MPPMWYDETFKKLTEACVARLGDPIQQSIVIKHKVRAPLAPTLGYNGEKLHANGHRRRTSSLERHENSPRDIDDHKIDVMNTLGLDVSVPVAAQKSTTEKENSTETGLIVKKKDGRSLTKMPGNQGQIFGENGPHEQDHRNSDPRKLHGKKNVAESQRSTPDPKPDTTSAPANFSRNTNGSTYGSGGKSVKNKKKGNNNKHRESGLRDEARIGSSSSEFSNPRAGHASKPLASRSILEDDHSIVSYTLNGEKCVSPNHSPEILMGRPSIQPSRESHDDHRNPSNSTTDGFRPETRSQFSGSTHPYGQSPFVEQPWHQVPMAPLPDSTEVPYMITPIVEMPPGQNPHVQWTSMHSQPPLPPVQSYGHMMDNAFYTVMQQHSGPSYHSQFDTIAGSFPSHNQAFQPYQPEAQYGRRGNRKRYTDDIRYAGDRPSYRRWNYPRGHPRGSPRTVSPELVRTANGPTHKMIPTHRTASQYDATDNPSNTTTYSPMNPGNDQTYHAYQELPNKAHKMISNSSLSEEALSSMATGTQTESIAVETILQCDEKPNETATDAASTSTIKYPMAYAKVDSSANTQKLADETAHTPIQQHSKDKETGATSHEDYVEDISSQASAPALAQNPTSETSTASVQNDNGKSSAQEHKLETSKGNRSISGPPQAAKSRTVKQSLSSSLPQETFPNDHFRKGDPLKLYVSGFHLTEGAVIKIFEPYNPIHISNIRLRKPWGVGNSNFKNEVKYVFVTFSTVNDCNAARRNLSGAIREGIRLKINPAIVRGPLEPAINEGPNLIANAANQCPDARISSNTNLGLKELPQIHNSKVSDKAITEHQASISTTSEKVRSLKNNLQKGSIKANTKPKKTSPNESFLTIPGEQATGLTQATIPTSTQPEFEAKNSATALLTEPAKEHQQANGAKSVQIGDLVKNLEAVETARQVAIPNSNKESEHSHSISVDSTVASSVIPDHPPVQSRLKKNKTKQKKKTKQRSEDTSVPDNHGATLDPASPHSSSISLNDQGQCFAASIEDSFESKSFKDEPETETSSRENNPSGLSESAQTFTAATPEPSHDTTAMMEEDNGNEAKYSTSTENDIKSGCEKHDLIVPPNSPTDIVMIDLTEEPDTESLPNSATSESPLENEYVDYVHPIMVSNTAQQISIGDEQNLQQINAISDYSHDSEHSYQSAHESSYNDDWEDIKFDRLLDNEIGAEKMIGQHSELHHSSPPIAVDRESHVPVARSKALQCLGTRCILITFDINDSGLTSYCPIDSTPDTHENSLDGSVEQSLSTCTQSEPSVTREEIRENNQANPEATCENAGTGSSAFYKATDDNAAQQDDHTKGWDKSVKFNTKSSRKNRYKARNHNSQSTKTSIEMIHQGRVNTGKGKGSTDQKQSAAKDKGSPESVKSNKST